MAIICRVVESSNRIIHRWPYRPAQPHLVSDLLVPPRQILLENIQGSRVDVVDRNPVRRAIGGYGCDRHIIRQLIFDAQRQPAALDVVLRRVGKCARNDLRQGSKYGREVAALVVVCVAGVERRPRRLLERSS
jgi:hypothetical protein